MSNLATSLGRFAELILSGPRGRDFCYFVAMAVNPDLMPPIFYSDNDHGGLAQLVVELANVDLQPIAAATDALSFIGPLGGAVAEAAYWQEPGEEQSLLSQPAVVEALRPIALAIGISPASDWMTSPVELDRQHIVRWIERGRRHADPPLLTGVVQRLHQWRAGTLEQETQAAANRPTAHAARYTGSWWSIPALAEIPTTSRSLGQLPAVRLDLVEDSLGWRQATVARVTITTDRRRIFEINEPDHWSNLVSRYPLDVDRSRRHDWWRTTGHLGPWQIPDWHAVGYDYDGVHLTVQGYLSTAGRALPTATAFTVLAGHDPDVTFWLTDNLAQAEPPTTWQESETTDDLTSWIRAT